VRIPFAKYEGLGNDFILIEAEQLEVEQVGGELGRELAVRLCDRHLGVGADGVLVSSTRNGRPRMQVINSDGSTPEMCGNGIRCVALHLTRKGRAPADSFEIDTDSGPHRCRVLRPGEACEVEVSMRAPSLRPEDVPLLADVPYVDAPIEVDGERIHITCVSMGNPHAVTFDYASPRREQLAAVVQADARFPQQVNVGFARMLGAQSMELFVFERGAGWTRACGTGACAASVAAVETGRAKRHEPIEVRLPGGSLAIVVGNQGERVSMTGRARQVLDGSVEI